MQGKLDRRRKLFARDGKGELLDVVALVALLMALYAAPTPRN